MLKYYYVGQKKFMEPIYCSISEHLSLNKSYMNFAISFSYLNMYHITHVSRDTKQKLRGNETLWNICEDYCILNL